MDFSRRFPDPPPHGEQEPVLVMRDALLSQLHMACLRREIVEAELAKIERAVALRAATGGQQTHTTPMPMPMPGHGVAAADAGLSKLSFNAEQPMAQQNVELHELPDSNKDPLLSQLHMARLRQEIVEAELAKIERAMALCAATGGHQTQTMPMPMPWHRVDGGRSKPSPFNAEQPMIAQQNAEFDEHMLPDSNKVVPPSKASPAEKCELTGITVPVMKLKPPMKWNCTVCPVQASSEQDLHQHYDGQKHLSNVAELDPTTKASDQKAKSAAGHSLGTEHLQKKTSSIQWSCSTCQAKGTSQSTLEAHLKGKRHQQNITATFVEGNIDGMPKNVTAQEAKSHGTSVPKNSDKPWPFIAEQPVAQEFDEHKLLDSNKVQAISEQDLQQHYAGQKHLANVATLHPTPKESNQNVETAAEPSHTEQKKMSSIKWSCSTSQAKGTSPSTLDSHLKGKRHQQNIAATSAKGDKNGIPSHSINVPKHSEKPPSAWICRICHALCTCESDLENHLAGKRHQLNIQVLREKQPSLCFCEVCNLLFESSTMLAHHRFGKKHRAKLSARNELS